MKNFYEDTPPSKFVAIYSDGSGCEIFMRKRDGLYTSPSSDGFDALDKDGLIDAGYLWFLPLPDNFEVWDMPSINNGETP